MECVVIWRVDFIQKTTSLSLVKGMKNKFAYVDIFMFLLVPCGDPRKQSMMTKPASGFCDDHLTICKANPLQTLLMMVDGKMVEGGWWKCLLSTFSLQCHHPCL